MRKIVAFIVAGMFLLCAQARADPADKAADDLNGCMYRIGLYLVGYQFDPAKVRETLTKVCADKIDSVITAMMPSNPDGLISIDEALERAAHSHVTKFLIDDFIKSYQSSLNIVRLRPMGVSVPPPVPPDLIPWLREKMQDKIETCDRIYSQKKEDLVKCVGDVSGSPIPP